MGRGETRSQCAHAGEPGAWSQQKQLCPPGKTWGECSRSVPSQRATRPSGQGGSLLNAARAWSCAESGHHRQLESWSLRRWKWSMTRKRPFHPSTDNGLKPAPTPCPNIPKSSKAPPPAYTLTRAQMLLKDFSSAEGPEPDSPSSFHDGAAAGAWAWKVSRYYGAGGSAQSATLTWVRQSLGVGDSQLGRDVGEWL